MPTPRRLYDVMVHFDSLLSPHSGAVPLGKENQLAASRKLRHGKTFRAGIWGMTETTRVTTNLPYGMRDDTESVSKIQLTAEARIVDDDGRDVELCQPGGLLIRGLFLCRVYHQNPEADENAFVDGGVICDWRCC